MTRNELQSLRREVARSLKAFEAAHSQREVALKIYGSAAERLRRAEEDFSAASAGTADQWVPEVMREAC